MTSSPTDWLQRVRALEPTIEAYRNEAEAIRQMPRPLFEALRDAGFFRLWVPRCFGGVELDMPSFILVIEELARLDGATGWNVMIGAEGGALAAYLPEAAAREFVAPQHAVVAGSTQPRGEAEVVEGGYRVRGVWPLASGCNHATLLAGACRVTERGRARTGPSGEVDVRIVVVPVTECEILDTWHAMGLRGTGSNDFRVRDILVPTDRSCSLSQGPVTQPGCVYGTTLPTLFALPVGAVALGIARTAIDSLVALAADKVRFGGSGPLAQDGLAQLTVGRAEARLRAARALVLDVAHDMARATVTVGRVPEATSRLVWLAATHAAETAAAVVTMLMKVAGSSAIYVGSRLERCFRDVHMVTQHRATNVFNFETAGRQLLEVEPSATIRA